MVRFRGARYTLDTIDADPDRIPRVPSSSPTRRTDVRDAEEHANERDTFVSIHPTPFASSSSSSHARIQRPNALERPGARRGGRTHRSDLMITKPSETAPPRVAKNPPSKSYEIPPIVSTRHHREPVVASRVIRSKIPPETASASKRKSLRNQSKSRKRTCALRSNPPVDPPKIGLGVFGLSFGAVQTAGAAAAAAFSSARTTSAAPRREEDARRVVARGVTTRTWEEVAERLNMFENENASRCADRWTTRARGEGDRSRASVCPRNGKHTCDGYI